MKQRVKVGVIGCGNISDAYFNRCRTMEVLDVVACADLDPVRARDKAAKHKLARACTVSELLAGDDIRIVLNLTVPQAHAEVAMAAVEAGKHVYNEKPLTVTREDGRRLLEAAKARGLLVGCAPDTFMGGGIQTCRKLIDEGAIGRPVAAAAFMLCPGHEMWHPNPEFYYKVGGGPMFDMGPYYLTALVNLLGPVRSVAGSTCKGRDPRTITSQPFHGKVVTVDVPTHVAGIMNFASGAVGTIVTSFEVWHHQMPFIEIYGTEGSLNVPDPNSFGGPVRLRRQGEEQWRDVPLTHGYAENSRGVGPADLACATLSGRPHRASGELAYHVLDMMHAFHDASDRARTITLESTCRQPTPLPTGLKDGTLDA